MSSTEKDEKEESSASAATDMEEDELCCPICLLAVPNDTVAGPCGHGLCVPCMERILLAKRPPNFNYHVDQDPDAHLLAPTLGRCPICRAELSLFELRKQHDHNKNETRSLFIEKNLDIHTSSIAGLTYARQHGAVGSYSFHFPTATQQNNKLDSSGRPLPYIGFEGVGHDVTLDNGSPPPSRKYFQKGCHFHEKTRTFHGNLVWSNEHQDDDEGTATTWNGSRVWEVVMQFSSDLRHVSGGTLVMRLDPPRGVAYPWPLDGKWKVTWDNSPSEIAYIHISGGEFRLGPFQYTLDTTNPKSPRFTWPMTTILDEGDNTATLQTAISGVDLEAQPQGPPVGGIVVWTTNDPEYTRIKWERQTIETSPRHKVQVFGPARGLVYHRIQTGATRSTSLPTHHANNLWGNTFIQGLKVGLASYHFVSNNNVYISYEHPLCGQWPPLDDGSPIPSQVPFRETTWDPSARVFCGNIEWQQDYGTTWQGAKRWMYEIRFDSKFTCIVSGKVETLLQDDQVHEMSTYGDNLVYINGGVQDLFNSMLANNSDNESQQQQDDASDQEQATPTGYERFRQVSRDVRRRLESEGVSVRTIAMIQRVFVSTQQPDSTETIDFNL